MRRLISSNWMLCALALSLGGAPLAAQEQKTLSLEALVPDWQNVIPEGCEHQVPQLPARIVQTVQGELLALGGSIVPLTRYGMGERLVLNARAVILDAAVDGQGDIWVGGRTNQRAWFPGADMADAYLGKFARNGTKLAEFQFGSRVWRQIVALHPLKDGDILVTGPIERSSARNGAWLARLSSIGKIRWERILGLPRDGAIAEGRDGNIAFVGLRQANLAGQAYREEVVFWLFDRHGNTLVEQVIRSDSNVHAGERYEAVALEASADGYFVLAGSHNPSNETPISVAKLSLAGLEQWRLSLPHTTSPWPGRSSVWRKCDARQTVLANGDLLMTCSIAGELLLTRLNGKTGTENTQRVALPACHEKRPAVVTPVRAKNDAVLLVGSRPMSNIAASCSWMAEWPVGR